MNTTISKLPLFCKNLSAYIIDESLLIYSNQTQNVYGFEKGDAALFLEIDELTSTYSFNELSRQFPTVDTVSLKSMYDLANCEEAIQDNQCSTDKDAGTYRVDELDRVYYQVDNIAFAIHYPDEEFYKYLHPVFEYIHVNRSDAKTMINIDFTRSGEAWNIFFNGIPEESPIPRSRLATYLQGQMMIYTCQAQPYLIFLHAASVGKHDKVIILPAESGSGKSTLTAAMLHRGYRLFTDESTSLDNDGYVHPLPFCINIKEGSWNVLSSIYPQLREPTKYRRFDDQKIHLLPPDALQQRRQKATHLIFPKYIPDAKTSLMPISVKEALMRISDSYKIQDRMDEQKFELILENLITLPRYTLVYSNLNEAIGHIDRVLEE